MSADVQTTDRDRLLDRYELALAMPVGPERDAELDALDEIAANNEEWIRKERLNARA